MSHIEYPTPDYAGRVPAERRLPPQSDMAAPPPAQPSEWLQPIPGSKPPEHEPGEDQETYVIMPEEDAAPKRHASVHGRRPQGRLLVKPAEGRTTAPVAGRMSTPGTAEQRLLVLDTWMRSGLPAGDFAPLVGVSKHTLYAWKTRFEADGPAGLQDRHRGGPKGSRLSELTKRAILRMKESNPDWGVERISDLLLRTDALAASPPAVAKVLHEAGYVCQDYPMRPHPDKIRFFERAAPNELWQTDLFTFMLKRQNQRVYLVAFMDDHSRFIVSYGLHASQSAALVLETMRAGIVSYGSPQEVLTDNGSQYITWRGKSQFAAECEKRGIRQIVSSPRRPQTLGKIERFWGSLWRECLESSLFADLADARTRIGHYIDHSNFQRPHKGAGGLVPADRYFCAAPTVLQTLSEQVAANALDISRNGMAKGPLYLTGNVDGQSISVHAAGDRVVVTAGEQRTEINFDPRQAPPVPAPLADRPVEQPRPAAPPGAGEVKPAPAERTSTPLTPPVPLPQPVSPVGMVDSPWSGAQEQPPGVSPLDALIPGGERTPGGAP